jgi:hypothetical protein
LLVGGASAEGEGMASAAGSVADESVCGNAGAGVETGAHRGVWGEAEEESCFREPSMRREPIRVGIERADLRDDADGPGRTGVFAAAVTSARWKGVAATACGGSGELAGVGSAFGADAGEIGALTCVVPSCDLERGTAGERGR